MKKQDITKLFKKTTKAVPAVSIAIDESKIQVVLQYDPQSKTVQMTPLVEDKPIVIIDLALALLLGRDQLIREEMAKRIQQANLQKVSVEKENAGVDD